MTVKQNISTAIRISDALRDRLKDAAWKRRISMAEAIRRALAEWIEREEKR